MSGFFAGPTPRIFGHRGAAGLAPENTLPSFALGIALGADVLELDVHGTRDGVVVVFHDPTLDRTTDGSGPLREHSFAELKRLDAGYRFSRNGQDFSYRGHGVRIPAFEDVLKAFPLARCNIEIKQEDPPIVEEVVSIIRRLDARHRVLLAAEHDSIMQRIRLHANDVATSFCTGEVIDFLERVSGRGFTDYRPVGRALQIPPHFGDIELVNPTTVAAAHRAGLEVHVWTINQADEMQRLLAFGVDGLISDLPGLARHVAGGPRK